MKIGFLHPGASGEDQQVKNLLVTIDDILKTAAAQSDVQMTDLVLWDSYHRRFITPGAKSTLQMLWGGKAGLPALEEFPSFLAKLKRTIRRGRWHGPYHLAVEIPTDSILIPRAFENEMRLVQCSASSRSVMKLGLGNISSYSVSRDYQTIVNAIDNGLAQHTPSIKAYEQIESKFTALQLEIVPNFLPYLSVSRGSWWKSCLVEKIIPKLTRFHQRIGCELTDACHWIDNTLEAAMSRSELRNHSFAAKLIRTLEKEKHLARGIMPVSFIHGDLHPVNFHQAGDKWWLFDWSCTIPMGIIYQIIAYPVSRWKRKEWEWMFCQAETSRLLEPNLRGYDLIWSDWMQSLTGEKVDRELFRIQVAASLLERMICIGPQDYQAARLTGNLTFPT